MALIDFPRIPDAERWFDSQQFRRRQAENPLVLGLANATDAALSCIVFRLGIRLKASSLLEPECILVLENNSMPLS
jgi:hypothetical protein